MFRSRKSRPLDAIDCELFTGPPVTDTGGRGSRLPNLSIEDSVVESFSVAKSIGQNLWVPNPKVEQFNVFMIGPTNIRTFSSLAPSVHIDNRMRIQSTHTIGGTGCTIRKQKINFQKSVHFLS